VAKSKKVSKNKRRKAIKKQLGYLKRNLSYQDIIQNLSMWIKFIVQEKIEIGVKNEGLE